MKTATETTETTVEQFSANPASLGREFTKVFTYETGRSEQPYLTMMVRSRVEGIDVLGKQVEQADLPRVLQAVENAQESRDATRADMGYCGDFPIYEAPALFTWESTKTFFYHTDPVNAAGSMVGAEWTDTQECSYRYFETVVEAEQSAQQHMDAMTGATVELTTL